MIYKRKKQALTLLEVLVSLSLLGLLLSILGMTYFPLLRTQKETKISIFHKQQEIFCLQRLEKLFFSLAATSSTVSLLEPEKLSLIYEAPIDPLFSGKVTSTLSINPQQQLLLTTSSENALATEILLQEVQHLTFSFFSPHSNQLETSWSGKEKKLPLWIRVTIETKHGILASSFRTSLSEEPIVYLYTQEQFR